MAGEYARNSFKLKTKIKERKIFMVKNKKY